MAAGGAGMTYQDQRLGTGSRTESGSVFQFGDHEASGVIQNPDDLLQCYTSAT